VSDDKDFLYRLAIMYYTEGLTQQEIAQRLGISRPQISRGLARAQEAGIVRIEIVPPSEGLSYLEEKLQRALGLHKVVVAPRMSRQGADRENRNQDIAICASKFIGEFLLGKNYVGIGWGDTVYRTALDLDFAKDSRDTYFVPLIGSLGMQESRYQVNSIVDRISEKMKGRSMFINSPAFMHDEQTRNNTLNQKQFSSMLQAWKRLDTAIIGLGVPVDYPGFPMSEFKPDNIERLKQAGVVGDILGQFFNKAGELCESGSEKEYIGIQIGDLRNIEQVICLSGGSPKVKGIIAAARSRYFTMLVTDERTANELVVELERME